MLYNVQIPKHTTITESFLCGDRQTKYQTSASKFDMLHLGMSDIADALVNWLGSHLGSHGMIYEVQWWLQCVFLEPQRGPGHVAAMACVVQSEQK
eukprot:5509140-Amphidinium_carterae.1